MSLEADRRRFASRWQGAVARARGRGARVVVGSGLRTLARNASIGGASRSQHLLGLAQDFPAAQGSRDAEILAQELRAAGLVVIDQPHGTGPHVHAQLYTAGEVPPEYFRGARPSVIRTGSPRAPIPKPSPPVVASAPSHPSSSPDRPAIGDPGAFSEVVWRGLRLRREVFA